MKIYLDNAASSKPVEYVLKAIKPFLSGFFGNPSSLHEFGRKSRESIESARAYIATILNSKPNEIIFTAGGTESINLAIFGVAKNFLRAYKKPGHIIVSKIEHEAVLECVKVLQQAGWKITYLDVNQNGFVNLDQLQQAIKKDTALVSIMYANNEVGTIQPIQKIGYIINGVNRERSKKNLPSIIFHTDACQAGGVLDLDVLKLKVDLLTLNGSKINGPKGSGILFIKSGVNLEPIIYGGGQERGLRSGTENTLGIIGFAAALQYAHTNQIKHIKQLHSLQTLLERELAKHKKLFTINGPTNSKLHTDEFNFGLTKLPGTTSFSVSNVEGEALMYYLDSLGFSVATGSACTTGSEDPSHVLLAMGLTSKQARSTIRISLGYDITRANIKAFVATLIQTTKQLQKTVQEL